MQRSALVSHAQKLLRLLVSSFRRHRLLQAEAPDDRSCLATSRWPGIASRHAGVAPAHWRRFAMLSCAIQDAVEAARCGRLALYPMSTYSLRSVAESKAAHPG